MLHTVKEGWHTFKSIFTGMGVTMRHLFQPSVTLQYPDERDVLPANARAKLYVDIDDCIGCNLCARACPVNCIDIETVMSTDDVDLGKTSTGNPKRFWLTRFDIDMAKCMYCDLCVHPCPTDCIKMVQEYEYSEFDRTNLVYHFSNLSPEMVAEVKDKAEKEAEEKKRQREEAKRKKEEEKKRKEAEAKKNEKEKDEKPAEEDDKNSDSTNKNNSDKKES
jgi:NADH-quinone oxidoreductase subunit I